MIGHSVLLVLCPWKFSLVFLEQFAFFVAALTCGFLFGGMIPVLM